jgi:hypothetical protein
VTASADLAAGTVTVEAGGSTRAAAKIVTSGAARTSSALVRRVRSGRRGNRVVAASDFDEDPESWEQSSSFNLPPQRTRVISGSGRYDKTSLHVVCNTGPGCGPATRIARAVARGQTYTASVWARSNSPGVRVSLVLGSRAPAITPGPPVTLEPRWRRLVVRWRAPRRADQIEVGVQRVGRGRASFQIDAATVREGASRLTRRQERQSLKAGGVAVIGPTTVRAEFGGSAPLAVSVGALGGAVAGGVAFLAWRAARRRKRQPE